jgi:hypothetical protein
MIVNRRTFNVKPTETEAAIEWLQQEIAKEQARSPLPGKARVYVTSIGTFSQVAMEAEFEDLTAYDRFWKTWFSRPECQAANEKFTKLLKGGGTNEIWTLIE